MATRARFNPLLSDGRSKYWPTFLKDAPEPSKLQLTPAERDKLRRMAQVDDRSWMRPESV